jgi:WD40 repeat protein
MAVYVARPTSGKILNRIAMPPDRVPKLLVFSPDGRQLACGMYANDGIGCLLLGASEGQVLHELKGRADTISYSADGKVVTTLGTDGTIRTWDAVSGKSLTERRSHPTECAKVYVSPDRKFLASATNRTVVHLWRADTAEALMAVVPLNDGLVYISPDGHYRGSPDVEKELVYVVQTDQGQETLTPAEFAKKYNWKNDPSKVGLKVESSAAHGPSSPVTKPDRSSAPAAVGQPKPVESKP